MSLWRQLTRGLRTLSNPTAADQDVVDEVQDYLDRATAAHMARGLSQEDARRAARQELGSLTSVTQQLREYGWEHVIDTCVADLRYGARRLRAAPAFTAITVLTLALGIGATTAIFSAVKPILLEPLPYPEAHRITMIGEVRHDGVRADGTFGMYRGLVERARSFEEIAVVKAWQPTLTGRDQPERLGGQRVSASYFQVLGVSPVLGRPFAASDDHVNGPNVIVLSDALWQRRFGGDPSHHRPAPHTRRQQPSGRRDHAARFRECARAVRRALGADAVRHVAGTDVGASPADGGPPAARSASRSGSHGTQPARAGRAG